MPALRPRRTATSARGRAQDSSSSYRHALSENTSPFKRDQSDALRGKPSLGGVSNASASTPTRRPLGERNLVPQVLIPQVDSTRKRSSLEAPPAARNVAQPLSSTERSGRSTRGTSTAARQLTNGPTVASAATTSRRTRSAAVPAEAQSADQLQVGNSRGAPTNPTLPAARAAGGSSKRQPSRSPPSTSHISIEIPPAKQHRQAKSLHPAPPAVPNKQAGISARDFAATAKAGQAEPAAETATVAQRPSAVMPDSDELEYIDPAVLLELAPAQPLDQGAPALNKDGSQRDSPSSSHTSSDKENRPPLHPRSSDDAGRLVPRAQTRRGRVVELAPPTGSSSVPQHSTPLGPRRVQARVAQVSSSGPALEQTRPRSPVLDDLFPLSPPEGELSRSVSLSPATRALLQQQQRQASDQESQLVRSQRQGYVKAQQWAHQQHISSMSSKGAEEDEDEAEIVKMIESSPPPLLPSISRSSSEGAASRSSPLAEPALIAATDDDEDPFGFFESQAKLKERRVAERQAERLERRNQSLHPLLSEKGDKDASTSAGPAEDPLDDAELARTAFKSSSSSPREDQRDARRRTTRRGKAQDDAGVKDPEASATIQTQLEKSVLPQPIEHEEVSLDADVSQAVQSLARADDVVAVTSRASSPLSSAPSSPRPSSPRKRSSKPRSYHRGSQPVVVIPGIPLKRTEVKEREMLERMARKSSPSASSSGSSAGQKRKWSRAAKTKKQMKMDDLLSLLPKRTVGHGGGSAAGSDDEDDESPPRGKQVARRGRKASTAKQGAKQAGRQAKTAAKQTTTRSKNGRATASTRRSVAAQEDGGQGDVSDTSSLTSVPQRSDRTPSPASKAPTRGRGDDWRRAVGSSDTRSSDSERTKRIKRYKKLDEYSLESELVL